MASMTFVSIADVFPVGTSVSAYLPGTLPGGARTSGSALATATVASDGTLTFTGLADDTAYVAWDGTRRRAFRTTPLVASDSVLPVARYVTSQPDSTHRIFDLARAVADMETSGGTLYIPRDGFIYKPSGASQTLNQNDAVSGSGDASLHYRFRIDGVLSLPDGMSSGDALLLRNKTAGGATVANAYGYGPRVIIEGNGKVIGGNSPNGTLLDSYASTLRLDISASGLLYVAKTDGYADLLDVNLHCESMTSGGWAFYQNYPGDGGRFRGKFYACAGLYLKKNNGGVIDGLIGGWHQFVESDLSLRGIHIEGDGLLDANTNPLISCQGSRLTFESGVMYLSTLRPAIETEDSSGTGRRHSSITLQPEFYFQQRLDDPGSAKGNLLGTCINIRTPAKETEVKLRRTRVRIFKQNATTSDVSFEYLAPTVTTPNSTTDEQNLKTVLDSRKALLAADVEVRYRNAAWEVDAPEPMAALRSTRRATSPAFVSAAASNPMTSGWTNLAAGTYFYKVYMLDVENRSTAVSSEVSCTIDGTNPVPKLSVNAYIAPCRLRILRGTVSGTYTHWAEIILAKETPEFYDQGNAIAGVAWSNTGVPSPPTVNSTYNGWVVRGANAVIFGTSTPTDGAWTQGDIMWNTGAAAAGSPGWICTASGTPGTWKAMPAVAA